MGEFCMNNIKYPSENCVFGRTVVEPRRVELLSEDQMTRASPSAVCVLTFPPRSSRKQDLRISSFIKSHRPQSLRRLVPCLYDADDLRRRRLRVDVRALSSCEFYVIVVVSSFKFPLMRQFRAAARFSTPPYPRRNQIRPHDMDPEEYDQYRSFMDRSISRLASRLAMSSRLSYSFLPLHRASSSFMRPSLRYT